METITKLFAGYSIGEDCYQEADRYCRPSGTRVLLIGGKTGLAKGRQMLVDALQDCGSELILVDTVIYGTECTYERIHELRDLYKQADIHMIFGMGGGKAIDTAKGVAWELGIPVFTFPTIASNCAPMAALSVVYRLDNSFDSFYYFERPAVHCFMNTDIMIHAPAQYLRAGMGDTIAKYFECHFSARGDELDYHSALGREISNLCYERILTYAKAALDERAAGVPGSAFEQVVLTIVVNTGLVSHMVEDCYNCAVAHSVCYGLNLIPGLEERYLHGDLVAYGVLIQLMLDGRAETVQEVRSLLKVMGIPVTLGQMGISLQGDMQKRVLQEIASGPDMEHIPYPVTQEMVCKAIQDVEELENGN
ncbi:MAG: iron-containing alcohol dehydrogenase family protein [Lachnospiraceae bacterium]